MKALRKTTVLDRLEAAGRPRRPIVVATPLGGSEGPEGPEGPAGSKGDTGATGAAGADGQDGISAGLRYRFLTATTNSDPGSGNLKLNGSAGAATIIRISETDADGVGQGTFLATWDDSTSTVKGIVLIRSIANPDRLILKQATAHADAGAYRNITVSSANDVVGSALENEEEVAVEFYRTGDAGEDGEDGAPGEDGADGAGFAEGTRFLWGRVTQGGEKVDGSAGWTSEKKATGRYRITFNEEFDALPTPVFSNHETAGRLPYRVYAINKGWFEIVMSETVNPGSFADSAFTFQVVG